jgi:hypothetical protein
MNGTKNDIDPATELVEEDEDQALPEPEPVVDLAADAGPLAVGRAVIANHAKLAPSSPGVYRMIDAKGDVLYVGKAKNIRKRTIAYTRPTGYDSRIERMIAATAALEFVSTATETEALLLEANLIKRLRPRFNVLLRDDKSFPYILIGRRRFSSTAAGAAARAITTVRLPRSGRSTAPSPRCSARSCCAPAPTDFSRAVPGRACSTRSSGAPVPARARSISRNTASSYVKPTPSCRARARP